MTRELVLNNILKQSANQTEKHIPTNEDKGESLSSFRLSRNTDSLLLSWPSRLLLLTFQLRSVFPVLSPGYCQRSLRRDALVERRCPGNQRTVAVALMFAYVALNAITSILRSSALESIECGACS
jgi:hypothetical protein